MTDDVGSQGAAIHSDGTEVSDVEAKNGGKHRAVDGAVVTKAVNIASPAEERHASWLELFFDLIVVAAAAQVAHRLHEADSLGKVAACGVLFYAVWSVWTAFSVYANVAGERTHKRALLIAMLGMGIMVASIPGAAPELLPAGTEHLDGRTLAFTIAFIACRTLAGQAARNAGKVITFWPAAQGIAVAPWLASIFVSADARYWLWGLGILIDVGFSIASSISPRAAERLTEGVQRRQDQDKRSLFRWIKHRLRSTPLEHPALSVAEMERGHLDERLGLFVIIVLGEAVAQIVSAAARVAWTGSVVIASMAGFLLLVAIWQLVDRYGFRLSPQASDVIPKPWVFMPVHFLVTAGIVGLAAGLGILAVHPSEHAHLEERWFLCGGLALCLVASALSGLAHRAPRSWLAGWVLSGLVVSTALGIFGGHFPGWISAVIAAAVMGWLVAYQPLVKIKMEGRTGLIAR